MFSLVITIVSIALVAALALATLFYGGTAYDKASGQARASTIVNQGQQLLGASELYYAKMGVWPASVDKLVEDGFLKDVPVVQNAVNPALAAQTWTMPLAGQPVFILQTETVGACRGVNEKVYGMDGILPRIQAGVVMQCYGTSAALTTMYSVAGRNAEHLMEVARSGQAPFTEADISTDPIPAADDALWLLKPGEKYAGVGGGTGTGGNTGGGSGDGSGGGGQTPDPEPEPVLPGEYELLAYSSFGSVATNTTANRTLTIRNKGQGPLALTMPPVLSNTTLFSLASNTCGATLAPTDTCEITVVYSPTEVSAQDQTTLSFGQGTPSITEEIVLNASAYNPVRLQEATVPSGTRTQAYTPFDFKALLQVSNEGSPDRSLATWAITAGALPSGLSLDQATGVISGTPTEVTAGATFTLETTYKNNKGQQVYVIQVGEYVFEVTQISSGGGHTCAVTPAGSLKCWGNNGNGQIGDGTTTARSLPTDVTALGTNVQSVSLGGSHTCAVTKSGEAFCWGSNSYGQLGDNSTTQRTTPVAVTGLSSGVSSIHAGHAHTCAVVNGGAKCWGENNDGRVGNGFKVSPQRTPFDVTGLGSGVVKLAAGNSHSCAILSTGAARCWGSNLAGQLGNGNNTEQLSPVAVSGISSGATDITAANRHTCAVVGGAARCWGFGTNGQLGNGSTADSNVPVNVTGLGSGVTAISAGAFGYSTCVRTSAGAISCWGNNENGQLGNNSTSRSLTPVSVTGLSSGVSAIAVGSGHACALTSTGPRCWGLNSSGQLGDGTLVNRSTPTAVR